MASLVKWRRYIPQSISQDVISKIERITLSTDDKIRRVLNSKQKEKFDRMQQVEERNLKREIERMEREASRKL